MQKEIYLDYAASTPIDPQVVSSMMPYFDVQFGNPSSLHVCGRRSRHVIEKARNEIGKIIGAHPDEIIFTGSGTEANNLALFGAARSYKNKGDHIIISSIEHKSVVETAHNLEREGFKISVIPVNKKGIIDVEACLALITEKTILISVMLVNNEIGTIQPIEELFSKIRGLGENRSPVLHVDACQAITLIPVMVGILNVDLLTLNSSKVYGPHGVGLLYKKKGITIQPLIVGGGQEGGMRAGTESVPLIVGFARALQLADQKRDSEYARLKFLNSHIVNELKHSIPHLLFNGDPDHCMPSIIHVTVPSIEGESMLMMLDHYGICVSTGSACSATDLRPSHVLLALGQNPELVHGSLRISLGRFTTHDEVEYFLQVFPGIVSTLTKLSPLANYEKHPENAF